MLPWRRGSSTTESISKMDSLKTFQRLTHSKSVQRTKLCVCGQKEMWLWLLSPECIKLKHGFISDELPTWCKACVGQKHWSSFDRGGHRWYTEKKYLACWCKSSFSPYMPCLPLPSTLASSAFKREIIRSGTKVFLSHYGLKGSWLSEYARGLWVMEGLKFLWVCWLSLPRSPFSVDPLVQFGSPPDSVDGCRQGLQWIKGT